MADKKKKMTAAHRLIKVPDNFSGMKPEEKWMFVRDMLATFSPNEAVRAERADRMPPTDK